MVDKVESTWTLIQEQLQRRMPAHQFHTWFENMRSAGEPVAGELTLRVPNEFFREWIHRHYHDTLLEVVRNVAPGISKVRLAVDTSIQPAAEPAEERAEEVAPAPATTDGIPLNTLYTFDHFVTGPSNRLAFAAAHAVADTPGGVYNPLYMHGAVGLGKSHLLQAICQELLRRKPPLKVIYLSCETFVNQFISAIQSGGLDQFRGRCRHADALVIDDIQFLARAERTQEEFFHTFNALHNAQKQIVLSSDSEPQDISMEPRLTSRFASGLVARIDPPSLETRMAILRRKAAVRGVTVPDDVIAFIAETFTANIREIEGALVKLVGYASLSQHAIDLELAREALAERPRAQQPINIQDILDSVASHFRARIADLQSKKRARSIVYPRQVCMYLARELTNLSLEEIGGYFGGRDHSTVLHADQKIREQAGAEPETAEMLRKLRDELVK